MYLQQQSDRLSGLIAAPPSSPPAAPRLPRIGCTEAQRQEVARILARPVDLAEIQAIVGRGIAGAIELARNAALPIDPARAALFEAVFGLAPTWHPAGAAWRLGGVVRKRYAMTADLLASGTLRIGCFGWPGGGGEPKRYLLQSVGDVYRIGLGEGFWEEVREGRSDVVASLLLAGALHVAFGQLVKLSLYPPTKNRAFCYLRYALHVGGRPIPAWIGEGCPIPPSRWHRLMPDPPAAPAPSPPPPPPAPARPPIRLRLTDEELERILGGKPADPLSAHIDWIITHAPPTPAARRSLGDQIGRKLDEAVDGISERLGVPAKYRKYVRKAARGAAEKGAKVIVEESLKQMGIDSQGAADAVWGAVEQLGRSTP